MSLRLTTAEARRIGIPSAGKPQDATSRAGRSKYRAVRVEAYGRVWASKAECRRYGILLLLGQAGQVRNLELQPRFPLRSLNGQRIADYVADFRYEERTRSGWCDVVEDVKSPVTARLPLYRLKIKLFCLQYSQFVFREIR